GRGGQGRPPTKTRSRNQTDAAASRYSKFSLEDSELAHMQGRSRIISAFVGLLILGLALVAYYYSKSNPVAFYNRGVAYYEKKDYDRAIADYTEAIRLDSNNAWAFYKRGRAKQMKGDASGGATDISRAKRLDPTLAY